MSFVPKFFYIPRKKWAKDSDVLEPGENYWKFQDDSDEENKSDNGVKRSIKELSIEEQAKQHCFKKILGILNKMTPDKFQTLMEEMKCESIDVGMLADVIFSKALVDEVYSEMYAKLCEEIMSELSEDHGIRFERILIFLCETGYENLLDFTDDDLNNVQEDKRYTFRRRVMTMMRFIGELACLKKPNFSRPYIWKMAECLIKKGEDLHLEAVYFLLFTISVRNKVTTWPKSIEKEVKKIFKLYSSGSLVSNGANAEQEKKESNLCLPGSSSDIVSDDQSCDNVSSVANGKLLKVEEGGFSFPDFLHSLVIVILDDSGNIKLAESTLLIPHVELMSKTVDCFKSQMHVYNSMSIISFNDRFSYDWFISHINKQLTAEKKFICIDADKYYETMFVVVKVNCDFARGVELFAKTEMEILKIISESNVDFPTSNWRIVQTSIKCVLQSYCFMITALVDSESSSLFGSSKNSINIGSDCAHVITSKLPSICDKETHDLKALENEDEATSDSSKNAIDKIDSASNKNKLIDSNESNVNQKNKNSARNKPKFKHKFYRARSFKSRRGMYNSHKNNNCNSESLVNEKQCCCNKEECCNKKESFPNASKTVNVCSKAEDVVIPSTSKAEDKSGTPMKELMSFNAYQYCNPNNKVKLNRTDKWRRARNHKNAERSYPEHDYNGQDVKKASPQNPPKPKWKSNNPDIVKYNDQHKSEAVFTNAVLRNNEMTDVQRSRRYTDKKIQQENQSNVQSKNRIMKSFDIAELLIKNNPQQLLQSPNHNADNQGGGSFKDMKAHLERVLSMQSSSRSITRNTHASAEPQVKSVSQQQKQQQQKQQQQPQAPNPNTYLKYSGQPLVIGIFPNSSQYKDETIFETLNNCNEGLDIYEQMVLCRFDQDKSVQLTFTVEDLTFKELQKTEFRVRYKGYVILVKPLTSWAEAMTFSDFNC